MTTQPAGGPSVAVVLTPGQAKDIARMFRSRLVSECDGTLAAPLRGPEDIARLKMVIDAYAQQLALLEWGEPRADIEMMCPTYLLDTITQELLEDGDEKIPDDDVAVCAVVAQLLEHVT